MKAFLLLAAAITAGTPSYRIDLGRYFANASAEQSSRTALLAAVDTFVATLQTHVDTPEALADWLAAYERLLVQLKKHDAYVYLRAERDSGDHADEAADAALSAALERVEDAAQTLLLTVGKDRLNSLMKSDAKLAAYRHAVDSILAAADHDTRNSDLISSLATPALQALGDSYKSLLPASSKQIDGDPNAKFDAKWQPYLRGETAFAAILLPIVHLRDGAARLEGYAGAPEATYSRAGLSNAEVDGVLAAIRGTDAAKQYDAVVAAAASRRLGLKANALHAWDLQAADAYRPPVLALSEAIPLILAAERPMGKDYAGQYARLFDPQAHRIDWCREANCDRTGFSLGFAGFDSVLFYGNYTGETDSIRAVAHEAGHAVHRQFMNEYQKIALYNAGPRFMFESFAVFNELLLLDHLYRSASTPEAKAYYLRQLLEDVVFQIYGSAQETDLEQSIYAGVRNNTLHNAADLDDLTLKVFKKYRRGVTLDPQMRVYWARNRLYFLDPLYDVNYMFAGLLAVEYLRQYEANPNRFSTRYVSLLKNGFTDSPQLLEKRFLDIDIDDAGSLVANSAALIEQRTKTLHSLYMR